MSCCPRKPGPPLRPDEDPSPEDVERFGSETVPCRFCGAEVYDEAEWCHTCGKSLGGEDDPARGPPVWFIAAAVVVVGGMILFAFRMI